MTDHPALKAVEVKYQTGRAEALTILRGMAVTDPAAAQAVKEIEQAGEAARAQRRAENRGQAAALGFDHPEQAQALVLKLATHPELFTWLCKRVHLTVAHDRALAEDE